jgi:plastocyanin
VLAAPAGGTGVHRMQVVAREFSLTLSRPKIHPGKATIQLANFGQDPHDLQIQKLNGGPQYGTGVVLPGTQANLTVKLTPGRYRLWCSLADHAALGMETTVLVKS